MPMRHAGVRTAPTGGSRSTPGVVRIDRGRPRPRAPRTRRRRRSERRTRRSPATDTPARPPGRSTDREWASARRCRSPQPAPGRIRPCRCPSARSTRPAATATADPELDPPEISSGQCGVGADAVGRPGADQTRGELIEVGDAHHHGARGLERQHGRRAALGHGRRSSGSPRSWRSPATSMLPFTASGGAGERHRFARRDTAVDIGRGRRATVARGTSSIQMPSRPSASIRSSASATAWWTRCDRRRAARSRALDGGEQRVRRGRPRRTPRPAS